MSVEDIGKLPINKPNLGELLSFLNRQPWDDEEREICLAEALCAYYLKGTRAEVQKTWMLDMTVLGRRTRVEISATPETLPPMLKNETGGKTNE